MFSKRQQMSEKGFAGVRELYESRASRNHSDRERINKLLESI